MRRAARKDDNQIEIEAAFRACGFEVADTSRLGDGFPDLTVYRPANGVLLVEVKDGSKPPSARKLTPAEADFARRFPVKLVESVDDVLTLAGQYDIPRKDLA